MDIQAELDKKRAERDAVTKEIDKLEATLIRQKIPLLTQTVGKCFKQRDRYSDGKSWWRYYKVVSIDKDGYFKTFEFAVNCDGYIGAENQFHANYSGENRFDDTVYIPISTAEFNRAKKAMLDRIEKMEK